MENNYTLYNHVQKDANFRTMTEQYIFMAQAYLNMETVSTRIDGREMRNCAACSRPHSRRVEEGKETGTFEGIHRVEKSKLRHDRTSDSP